jgi:hypothetical protein
MRLSDTDYEAST